MTRPTRGGRGKARARKAAAPTVDDRGGRGTSRIEVACWALLVAAAVGGLIWLQRATFFYSWSDEQINLYVAQRIEQGAVLYRDVDSARPPLVLFPVAWLIRMGLSPLLAGRAMVLGSQLGIAGLLFWGGRFLLSWRAGALAALLFLSSPEAFSRIHYTGIHLVALTALACVLFSLRARPLWAGLSFGLSLAAGQHGVVICAVAAVITIRRRWRDGLSFASGAVIVSGVIFGAARALGGQHIWEDLVRHHLYHLSFERSNGAQFWEVARPWLYEHGYLFIGVALAIVFLRTRRTEGENDVPGQSSATSLRTLLIVTGAHLAAVLAISGAVFLYVVVIVPSLTLLAGMGIDATIRSYRDRGQLSRARARLVSRLTLAAGAVAATLTVAGWSAARSHRERLDERAYSFWPHVRHGQMTVSQRLDVATQVASDPMLPKHRTIFGDPTIVSAVALQSGLRVSGELADLDLIWIGKGTVTREQVVSRIERDGVAAVITPPWFMVQDPYFRSYLMACYREPKVFSPPESGPGAGLPDILVFPHVDGGSASCRIPAAQ
jgi:hypothetical protein